MGPGHSHGHKGVNPWGYTRTHPWVFIQDVTNIETYWLHRTIKMYLPLSQPLFHLIADNFLNIFILHEP